MAAEINNPEEGKAVVKGATAFNQLEPEPRNFMDKFVGFFAAFLGWLANYAAVKNENTDLAAIQEENRFSFGTQLLATFVATIIATAVAIRLSSDSIDEAVSYLDPSNSLRDPSAFAQWAIGFPLIASLFVCSFIFYSVTFQYILVFRKTVFNNNIDVVPFIRFLIFCSQLLIPFVFAMGPHWLLLAFASIIFFLAAFATRHITKNIDDSIVRINRLIDGDKFPRRKARTQYIHASKTIQQTQRGWIILNTLFAMFFLAIAVPLLLSGDSGNTFFNKVIETKIAYEIRAGFWAIFAIMSISSIAGAYRQNNHYMNRRYFSCARILNTESKILEDDPPNDDRGHQVELALQRQVFYSFESDQALTATHSPESQPFNRVIVGLFRSSRFLGSLAFSGIVYGASADLGFTALTLLALLFSYLLNDLWDFDIGKDQVVHPERPLPSGMLTTHAVRCALIAIVAVFALALLVGLTRNWPAPVLLLSVGAIYSVVLKHRLPVLATPFWCAGIAIVLASALQESIVIFLGIWAIVLGREIVLEFRDADADFAFNGSRNLGFLMGSTTWLVSAMTFLAGGSLFWVAGQHTLGIAVGLIGSAIVLISYSVGRGLRDDRIAVRVYAWTTHLVWPLAFLNV